MSYELQVIARECLHGQVQVHNDSSQSLFGMGEVVRMAADWSYEIETDDKPRLPPFQLHIPCTPFGWFTL
jgi:hypothetical protein